jgi:uncharacterized protein
VTERSVFFLWSLFQQLVRRNFAVGLEEYEAARRALRAGFGWSSRDELREVLRALWASSREESAVISALFEQYAIPDWNLTTPQPSPTDSATPEIPQVSFGESETDAGRQLSSDSPETNPINPESPELITTGRLPPLSSEDMPKLPFSHVFLTQYPVSFRDVAQTWRRLRWPVREGAATELDVEATVARRSRSGVATAPVLRPRRRNQARVLLLIDRKGSMAPFHRYVDEIRAAIVQAGRLGAVGCYYFHDIPLAGADLTLLGRLDGRMPTGVDTLLHDINALTEGEFYSDPELLIPRPAKTIFEEWPTDTAIVVLSDGGAARGRFDMVRLLDSIASLKGLLTVTSRLVWLNPVPKAQWGRSTAGQIARYVPMFPLDRDGMHRAVNVLRGQPFVLERSLTGANQSREMVA